MPFVYVSKIINTYIISALLLTFCLVLVTVIDVVILANISPWHDELWNLYTSLQIFGIANGLWPGCSQNMCIDIFGLNMPVLSGPYHGAIKSYLFSPIVLLGNIGLIRAINLVIYFAPLLYVFKQKKYFGTVGVFLISTAYFLYFPNLIFEAAFDQGQFVVCNAFLVIASIIIVKSYASNKSRPLVLAIVLSSLALYEKLTNIPVAISLIFASIMILLFRKEYRLVVLSGLNIIIVFPYVNYLKNNMTSFLGMTSAQSMTYLENLKLLLNSTYNSLFEKSFTLSSMNGEIVSNYFPLISVALLLILYFFIALRIYVDLYRRIEYMIVWAIPLFAILLFPFFDGLNRPWHIYQLAPLIVIPFGLLSLQYNAVETIKEHNLLKGIYVVLVTIGLLNTGNIAVATVNRARVHPYDESLYVIANEIKRDRRSVNIVCLDYSVCYNLVLMLGRDYKLLAEWAFAPEKDIFENIKSLNGWNYYLVTHENKKYSPGDDSNNDFLYGRSFYFRNNFDLGTLRLQQVITSKSDPGYVVYLHE